MANQEQLHELALFAGAGGGILGGCLLGWRTVCAVEINEYARSVLIQRQNDGRLQPFPIWDDIRTFDGKAWRGSVDVVSGGFPCQDISAAGKGAGISGERSGLWKEMARIIREVRPRYCFVENSPMLTSRGLGDVLGDLAEMGYDAKWCVLGANHTGGFHGRGRIWILANVDINANGIIRKKWKRGNIFKRRSTFGGKGFMADRRHKRERNITSQSRMEERNGPIPGLVRVVNGVADRVDRLKAIGNGQVPAVAATAWRILTGSDDG